MNIDFVGKTALVTGASRGIGFQIARDLANSGADLIVTSTKPEDRSRLVDAFGPTTRHYAVDLADDGARARFVDDIRSLSALHVCVNNAGVAVHGPLQAVDENTWNRTHDVNLKAPFFVSQAAADVMRRGSYGRIVNISSIWAHMTMPARAVYTATKFGLRGLSKTFALELARHNVLVNVVAPGFTLTDMVRDNYAAERLREIAARIPLGRLATTEEISRAVMFLASDLNTYITGQSLIVDGGYTVG